jgi:uncharacterized sporulation protein YeaH/YhbH (DUF444 family)
MATKEELRIEKDKAKAKEQLDRYKFAERFYSRIKDSNPEKQALKQLANMAEEDLESIAQRDIDQYPKGFYDPDTGKRSQNAEPMQEKRVKPKLPYKTADDFKKGGKVSSASKRADGIAVKGKTRGRIV